MFALVVDCTTIISQRTAFLDAIAVGVTDPLSCHISVVVTAVAGTVTRFYVVDSEHGHRVHIISPGNKVVLLIDKYHRRDLGGEISALPAHDPLPDVAVDNLPPRSLARLSLYFERIRAYYYPIEQADGDIELEGVNIALIKLDIW